MLLKMLRFLSIIAMLAAAFIPLRKTQTAAAMPCDPAYVTIAGSQIIVAPTGTNDTANLQCAFDTAIAAGAKATIRLAAGTFHTAQVVANGFQGKFTGAGIEATKIINLMNLYVTPVDFYFYPPSAEHPAPFLFAFVGGDFTISQLSIHIHGEEITQGWSIFGIEPPIKILAGAVVIEGEQVNASVDHVLVEGEAVPDSMFGYNLINGIYFEGFIGEVPPPATGRFQVTHSTFRSINGGVPLTNVADASILISHNVFEDNLWAVVGSDFLNSSFEFSYNQVEAFQGVWLYTTFMPEDVGTSFVVKDNHFKGQDGVVFQQLYGAGNQCLITNNNVKQLTGQLAILGDGVSCEVK